MSEVELIVKGASHDRLAEIPVVEVSVRRKCTICVKTHQMYNGVR